MTAPPRQRHSPLRRAAVGTAGGLVIALGLALLVLPGPGLLVVVAGLGILSSEFPWARSLLVRARAKAQAASARSASSATAFTLTLLTGAALVAAGVLCFADVSFGVSAIGALTTPLTGSLLVLSGLFVIVATSYQRAQAE